MKGRYLFGILLLMMATMVAQQPQVTAKEVDVNEYIKGTLLHSPDGKKGPLVIIVHGSGPVDRNGNQSFMKNDAYKKLAADLADQGIDSYRFDKRILQMERLGIREQDISFDDFVTDVVSIIDHFRSYDNIIVLGHSQGSLVGMIAAQGKADAFISIAGAAKPIDSVIVEQIVGQMPGLKENALQSFQELKEKGSTTKYNPMLEMIFRPSVQPFILSWMQYDPREEIKKLKIPVLLINGTNDVQVKEKEAKLLQQAKPEAQLVLLKDMNHVFRKIEGGDLENSKSYNDTNLPLHPELTSTIVDFINGLE